MLGKILVDAYIIGILIVGSVIGGIYVLGGLLIFVDWLKNRKNPEWIKKRKEQKRFAESQAMLRDAGII